MFDIQLKNNNNSKSVMKSGVFLLLFVKKSVQREDSGQKIKKS